MARSGERTSGRKIPQTSGSPSLTGISSSISAFIEAGLPIEIAGWGITDPQWETVKQACRVCGADVNRLATMEQVHTFSQTNRHSAAIIALEEPPASTSLFVVSCLKNAGIKVIAYKDFLNSWSLGTKCRALLAGACHLLDSNTDTFGEQLVSCLQGLLDSRREMIRETNRILAVAMTHGIVGGSESILGTLRQLIRVSELSDLPILISGESGTGKELFASAVHTLDPKRFNGPFMPVNCAVISAGVAESELFGHVKGAFTNASHDHNGFFLAAQNGILFLDEIGELSLEVQAKLLRVLQQKRFFRVGSTQEKAVDVRIVAATNRNLIQLVKEGRFREDLFHRLNALSIHIDPLRERTSDLPLLVDHIVSSHKSWCGEVLVDPELAEAFSRLELKGNVRELANLITAALVARADRNFLSIGDLPPEVLEEIFDADSKASKLVGQMQANKNALVPGPVEKKTETHGPAADVSIEKELNLHVCLNQREREVLQAAMRYTHNNQSEAARVLGITPRSVYNKLRKFDMLNRPAA